MLNKNKFILLAFLLIFTVTLFLFYKLIITSYFFQDDWFTLKISSAGNFSQFLLFFIPRGDVIYYRPLGMQVPFFILNSLFPINPLPFRILTLITHYFAIVLVYLLLKKLVKNELFSLLGCFFYATSACFYIPFLWSSTYSFVLGPVFVFLTLLSWIDFADTGKNKHILNSFIYFVLGIMTNEIIITTVVIMILYLIFYKKDRKYYRYVLPHFLIAFILFLLRFTIFKVPARDSYALGIGMEMIQNVKGYILWTLNFPEEIKSQFVSFFALNREFISQFSGFLTIFTISGLIIFTVMVVIPIILFLRNNSKVRAKYLIFGLLWYFIGLIPVILFSTHTYSYYLSVSLIGFLVIGLGVYSDIYLHSGKLARSAVTSVMFLALFMWIIASFATMNFNDRIHWAARRSRFSKKLIMLSRKFTPNEKECIKFKASSPKDIEGGTGDEYRLALNDQDAFRLIYNNECIETVYKNILVPGGLVL